MNGFVEGEQEAPAPAPGVTWNPRYVAYATYQGKSPREMLPADKKRWPGACMVGFSQFIMRRWDEWKEQNGHPAKEPAIGTEYEPHFDAWLGAWVEARTDTDPADDPYHVWDTQGDDEATS